MPTPFDNTYELSEKQLLDLEKAEEMMLKNDLGNAEELLLDMKKDLTVCKTMPKKGSNAKKRIDEITSNALQRVTQHWHDITDAGWTLEDVLGPWAASARMQGFTDLDFQG